MMHPDIIALLNTRNSVDVAVLFEVSYKLGNTTSYIRHSIDNFPLVDSSGNAWSAWIIDTQEFISRLNESTQPTEITIFDPEDTSLPGRFKSLLQYEKILNRATFNLWLVFKDPSPNITQQTISTSVTTNSTTLNFSSAHQLNIFDRIEIFDGTAYVEHRVISVSGNSLTTDKASTIPQVTTVRKPYFKDNTTWHKKISGKLRGASYAEGFTVLKISQESDLLTFDIPNVTYSYQCPYKPGDSNCIRKTTPIIVNDTYNVVSTNGNQVIVQGNTVFPGTNNDYWSLGSMSGLTGSISGIIRSIRKTTVNSPVAGQITLITDQPILGNITSGTVELHFNCNRSFKDCKDRFSNNINFGGLQTIVRSVGGINVPRQISNK